MSTQIHAVFFPDGSTMKVVGERPGYVYTLEPLTWWQRIWRSPRVIEWTCAYYERTGEYYATAPTTEHLHQQGAPCPPFLWGTTDDEYRRRRLASLHAVEQHIRTILDPRLQRTEPRDPSADPKVATIKMTLILDDGSVVKNWAIIPGHGITICDVSSHNNEIGHPVHSIELRAEWTDQLDEVREI